MMVAGRSNRFNRFQGFPDRTSGTIETSGTFGTRRFALPPATGDGNEIENKEGRDEALH
jgi:hypothetical protein